MDERLIALVESERNSKIPAPLYTLNPYERGRLIAEALGERFNPLDHARYENLYQAASASVAEGVKREEETRIKNQEDALQKIEASVVPILKKLFEIRDEANNRFTIGDSLKWARIGTAATVIRNSGNTISREVIGADCRWNDKEFPSLPALKARLRDFSERVLRNETRLNEVEVYKFFEGFGFRLTCPLVYPHECRALLGDKGCRMREFQLVER